MFYGFIEADYRWQEKSIRRRTSAERQVARSDAYTSPLQAARDTSAQLATVEAQRFQVHQLSQLRRNLPACSRDSQPFYIGKTGQFGWNFRIVQVEMQAFQVVQLQQYLPARRHWRESVPRGDGSAPDGEPMSPAGSVQHWPPGGDRQRQHRCGRPAPVVASSGCSWSGVGFPCQKPLSPKPGALSHPLIKPLRSSFRWIGAKRTIPPLLESTTGGCKMPTRR